MGASVKDVAERSATKRARFALFAACFFAFWLLLWCVFVAPRFTAVFGWDVDLNQNGTITHLEPGMAASRAGVKVGDMVLPLTGTVSERLSQRLAIAGVPARIDVRRGNRHLTFMIVPDRLKSGLRVWLELAQSFWLIAFATIIARCATSRRPRLLSWFLLAQGTATLLGDTNTGGFMSPWPWVNDTANLLANPVNSLANASFVPVASSFSLPLSMQRRRLEMGTYAFAFVSAIAGMAAEFSVIGSSVNLAGVLWTTTFWSNTATVVLALATGCMALISVRAEERQRARWLLGPMIALFTIDLVSALASQHAGWWTGQQLINIVTDLVSFVVPAVLAYAVLTHRLVDIDFIINRATVFAGVSFVVIGVFIAAEWLLSSIFAQTTRTASVFISLAIALVLGTSLRYIHRYVDRIVDQLFFRTRHEHERSLRTFASEAAFITDYDTLLDDTMREVSTNVETDFVSILLSDTDGTYSSVRCTNGTVHRIPENDRAVVKMRTWHTPVHIHDVNTALNGVWAYPLMFRGTVLGILVCGPKRDGQSYAPDEGDALSVLAQGVGAALGTLTRSDAALSTDIRDLKIQMNRALDLLQSLVTDRVSGQQ